LTKFISNIIYFFIKTINYFYKKITNKSLNAYIKDLIEKDSYKKITLLNKQIFFFSPNEITEFRVNTLFKKEPETINWINNFKKEKTIFWDIGANIGLYSIYAAVKNPNLEIISFEPSTSNLRILSRNISINGLQERIKIYQVALSNETNKFQMFEESEFIEGWSMNTFGAGTDFEGKKIHSKNKYKLFGTDINFLLKNDILSIPCYIKIDVDGIEHLILKGGSEFLKNPKIESILIEVNENYKSQYENILEIMKENKFKFEKKDFVGSEIFPKNFNYIFKKNKF